MVQSVTWQKFRLMRIGDRLMATQDKTAADGKPAPAIDLNDGHAGSLEMHLRRYQGISRLRRWRPHGDWLATGQSLRDPRFA
jgi:hypothetical protein